MPKLSELTDYEPEIPVQQQERIYVSPAMPTSDSGDYFNKPVAPMPELPADNIVERIIKKLAETEFSSGTDIGNKLAGTGGKERYQLWPEKVIRSALTAIPDAYSGKIPMHDVDPETGELVPSQAMTERALDMATFAGVGGLGGTGKGAGTSLGIVPVDVAKKLNFKTAEHPEILKQAIENTPAASVDADGHLIVKLLRSQHPDQEMAESVRGGVFYLPEGSPNARHYNGTTGNNYGGNQAIKGETAFVNPLTVKGATGGKAPEAAYTQLLGKDAFKQLEKDIHEVITADIYKKQAPWMKQELTQKFLEKHAPELVNHADYILENSAKGNQLRYALQEAAVASAVRSAGHDGVVGYSVGRGVNKGKPFLSEIYDVRENRYPSPNGDFSVHPELYADSSKPAAAIQGVSASRGGPSLRPALKYKDRLYKGKEGQQHMDVIPPQLYPEFQQMAMRGDDISHYNFGFVNDKGHFLSREDALKYGIDTGLIDPQAGKFGALTSTLMADSSKPGVAIESMAKTAQPFYSAVEHTVNSIPQAKMNGEAWLGTLANKPGVKPEELDWTGLKSFLEENKGKPVTKEQVQEHLANNKVELKEVQKGGRANNSKELDDLADEHFGQDFNDLSEPRRAEILQLAGGENSGTKYHSYQLPGGENYREMLMTLPHKENPNLKGWDRITADSQNYKSSHWDEPNILAHVRMNDRTIDGKKSLHLEEIQSDWHQQGRDKGYRPEQEKKLAELVKQREDLQKEASVLSTKDDRYKEIYAELPKLQSKINDIGSGGVGVPDAPFKKSWHELALKRMLREAAEKGYDRLSWTPGEAQAERYSLSAHVGKLKAIPIADQHGLKYEVRGWKPNGDTYDSPAFSKVVTADELPNAVGKEMAKKIIDESGGKKPVEYSGLDLKVGGEGMKGFYDQIIPKALEKLGKEHGVKVKQTIIDATKRDAMGRKSGDIIKQPVHFIDIPQSLKDRAMQKGFPLFSSAFPGYIFKPVDGDPFND
jgi:hypothetical protein